MKLFSLLLMLISTAGCVGFHRSPYKNSDEKITLPREIYYSLEVVSKIGGEKVHLPEHLDLEKIFQTYSECSETRQIAHARKFDLSDQEIGLLELACYFYKNLAKQSNQVKWKLLKSSDSKEDVYIDFVLLRSKDSKALESAWMLTSLLTLFVVPYWSSQEIGLSATIYKNNGKNLLKSYNLNGEWKSFAQTLLLFVQPFIDTPQNAYVETINTVTVEMIKSLSRDEVLLASSENRKENNVKNINKNK